MLDNARIEGQNTWMKPQFIIILFVFAIMSVSASGQTGDIQGIVYQQRTGTPLAEANVRILETDRNQKTDKNGTFRFTELREGTYVFIVTHPTETVHTEVSVKISSGDTTEVKIHLGVAVKLETIIVEGKRLPPTISRMDVRGSELLRIPGTLNDTLKGLMTLPSIGIPNDYFGVLYIRGSEPGSNLYYLDRTPLGYPFHWGGLLSTVSSETLEKIDIYAGGYGAEFGLDSQAVLDIHARDSIDEHLDGKFNLNILYSEGLLEGRIGNKGYISVSGRRSYLDLIAESIIELQTDTERQTGTAQELPYFSDYQLKSTYALTEKHHLTVNAFAAVDRFKIVENQEFDKNVVWRGRDELPHNSVLFENGFNGQGIHLRSNLTERLRFYLSLTRSDNFLNIDLKSVVETQYGMQPNGKREFLGANYAHYEIRVNAPVYALREDVAYTLTRAFQLESGFLYTFSPAASSEKGWFEENLELDRESEYTIEEPLEFTIEGPDGEVVRELIFEETHDEFGHNFHRTEGYVQGRYDPLSFLSVALGVRLDYLNVIEQISVQPRGSVSFQLPNGSNLRFAYGHYERSPQPSHLLAENGNRALKSSLTRHYIMEFEYPLSLRTELKFATYYKDAQKLVTPDEVSNYLNQGSGYVGGAEIFFRHQIPERFFGWISYSYTHAERRENPDVAYIPYLFGNTHIVSIVGNYSFTPNFEIGAKWQYLSGTSEAPISSIVLVQDPVTRGLNSLVSRADEELSTQLAPYHKLDLRVSHKWNVWGSQVGGFLDILNIYNRRNKIQFIFEEATLDVQGQDVNIEREVFDAPQLPRIIYFGLTLEF